MSTSSQESNIVWTYVNDSVVQEVTVTTAAHPAEVQAGAMRMNMIPKDGGNVFSGSVFLGGSDGSWQAKQHRRLPAQPERDERQRHRARPDVQRLARRAGQAQSPVVLRHDAPRVDRRGGRQRRRGHRDTAGRAAPAAPSISTSATRWGELTWQINQKNKLAVFFNRTWKRKGKDFGAGADPRSGSYRDPRTGQVRRRPGKVHEHADQRGGCSKPGIPRRSTTSPSTTSQASACRGIWPTAQLNPAWLANARREDTANNINPAMRAVDRLPRVGVERTGSAYDRDRPPHRRVGLVRDRHAIT